MGGVPAAAARKAARVDRARQHVVRRACEPAVDPAYSEAGRGASFPRRIGASAYEALAIAAVLIAVAFVLLPVVTPSRAPGTASGSLYVMSPGARALSAIVSFAACTLYCAGLWSGGRRTLAMKTWHLELRTPEDRRPGVGRALRRYLACLAGPALAVAGYATLQPLGHGRWALVLLAFNYAWAIVDPDRQFLQDRLAGTRLVLDRESRASQPPDA